MICRPFSGLKRSSRACERNITTRICAPSSLSVKYRCPDSAGRKLEISPSTHTSVYSRSTRVRRSDMRSRTLQIRRVGWKVKPSCSLRDMKLQFKHDVSETEEDESFGDLAAQPCGFSEPQTLAPLLERRHRAFLCLNSLQPLATLGVAFLRGQKRGVVILDFR